MAEDSLFPGADTAAAALPRAESLPRSLRAELRSDHAGETGAVFIYRGILALSREPAVRAFAEQHLATEQTHLQLFDTWLDEASRSRLLPLWRLSGWLLGALAAVAGARAVFHTIEAVEQFVVQHYQQQLDWLQEHRLYPEIACLLRVCQQDEEHHRRDAALRAGAAAPGRIARLWARVVGGGSQLAVRVARVI